MAKAASNGQLRQALEEHLRQTSEHVSRLEQTFETLEEKPSGRKCMGMEGLVKEGVGGYEAGLQRLGKGRGDHRRDPAGRTLRNGWVRDGAGLPKLLGESEHVSLLQETLNEEKQADDMLTQLAAEINASAEQARSSMAESSRETSAGKSRTRRAA